MHWVSAAHAVPAEIRLYDRLFTEERLNDLDDAAFKAADQSRTRWNSDESCVEQDLAKAKPGERVQLERQDTAVWFGFYRWNARIQSLPSLRRDALGKIRQTREG
jgi:hypothetical protein